MKKKKIIILGSTGSIGKSTLDIIKKDKKSFQVILLTANRNYKRLIKQAKEFKPKFVLIKNHKFYSKVTNELKHAKVYSGDISIQKIISSKVDFTMSAIVGLAGLQPTIDAIKLSKTVAIANKESIICAWHILSKLKKKYKTEILPVDSEHFSIRELTKNIKEDDIEEIIITASGGPFLNIPINKLKYVKPNQAINHPNWKMGKKISVDSANMMNKVFELIEAYNFFGFKKNIYRILIHPQSYVHSIVRFKNGLIKMILYNPDMKIPISNILYNEKKPSIQISKIDPKKLNELTFKEVNIKNFPSIKLIKKCLNEGFSAPIIANASNEVLVNLFLKNKIGFLDIVDNIQEIFKDKDFKKYARRSTKSVKDINIIDNWARLKTTNMCVR